VGSDFRGRHVVKEAFARPVGTPDDARAALVAMLTDARSKLA